MAVQEAYVLPQEACWSPRNIRKGLAQNIWLQVLLRWSRTYCAGACVLHLCFAGYD
jgi:hypothetical protein